MKTTKFLIIAIFIALVSNTYAQESLLVTKEKDVEWNEYTKKWDWDDEWYYNDADEYWTIKFTVLNSESTEFLVEELDGDFYESYTVSYIGYDREYGIFEYENFDAKGEYETKKIWVKNTNLTSLAMNGWPEKGVFVYFWYDEFAIIITNN